MLEEPPGGAQRGTPPINRPPGFQTDRGGRAGDVGLVELDVDVPRRDGESCERPSGGSGDDPGQTGAVKPHRERDQGMLELGREGGGHR